MFAVAIKLQLPQGYDNLFGSILEAGLSLMPLYHLFEELLESFVRLLGLKVIGEVLLRVVQDPDQTFVDELVNEWVHSHYASTHRLYQVLKLLFLQLLDPSHILSQVVDVAEFCEDFKLVFLGSEG